MFNTTINSLVLTRIYSSPFFNGDQSKLSLKHSSFSFFTGKIFSQVLSLDIQETSFQHILNNVIKISSITEKSKDLSGLDRIVMKDSDTRETITIKKCYFHDVICSSSGACISYHQESAHSDVIIYDSYFRGIYTSYYGGVVYAPKIYALWTHNNCFDDCSAAKGGHIFDVRSSRYEAEVNKSATVYAGMKSKTASLYTINLLNGRQILVYYVNISQTTSLPNSIDTITGVSLQCNYRMWITNTYFLNCSDGILIKTDLSKNPSTAFDRIIACGNIATQGPFLLPMNGAHFFYRLYFRENKGIVFTRYPYGDAGLYVSKSYFDFPQPLDDDYSIWISFDKCHFNTLEKTPNYYAIHSGNCESSATSDKILLIILLCTIIPGSFILIGVIFCIVFCAFHDCCDCCRCCCDC